MPHCEEKLVRYLKNNQPLEDLTAIAAKMKISCWLVGGALRDILLDRPVADVDLATEFDPTPLAKYWAMQQKGHWFWLDQERLQSRVLLRYGRLEFYFDFAPLRAATLDQDLSQRDFTINALALSLSNPLTRQQLIDPLDGRTDLLNRRLRTCSRQSFADDPLRIVKGIRHAVSLDLHISDDTEQQMINQSASLTSIAAERIRNELGRIFESEQPEKGLALLDRCGLLPILFTEPEEGFSLVRFLPELTDFKNTLKRWSTETTLAGILEEHFEETMTRRSVYTLALFLRNYSCCGLDEVLMERLRLSRRSTATIKNILSSEADCLNSYATLPDSDRARVLWLESLGKTALDQLLFFATLNESAPFTAEELRLLLENYHASVSHGRIPNLLSGQEIKQHLPGVDDKRIGLLQQRIKAAEISGEITTVNDAREFIGSEFSIDNS